MSPEPFVSRPKAVPAKRSEKGYGDENHLPQLWTELIVNINSAVNELRVGEKKLASLILLQIW